MSTNKPRLLITGSSGHLGRLVIEHLRRLDPDADITAMVRTQQAAEELAPFRVTTRIGDYTDPASLDAALIGIDRLLLISSSVLGQRAAHHKNVIDAATRAKVSLIAYTSILRADTSELSLAAEHLATENMLRGTGLPFVILRNGWYLENDTEMLAPAVAWRDHWQRGRWTTFVGEPIELRGGGSIGGAARGTRRYRLRTRRRRGVHVDTACGDGERTNRKDG
jgi:NAD(P)H dehydrogenase (quinone)